MKSFVNLAVCLLPLAFAAPTVEKRQAGSPTVALSYATVVGSSSNGVDSFKGIPYAQPPVGQLRLKPPKPIAANLGTVQATGTPRACPQFLTQADTTNIPLNVITALADSPFGQAATNAGEDCLTVNVQRPSTATASSKLPVLFWIYGGGFEFGSTQQNDASQLIMTSVAQGKDIIYVAVNYRLGGFGFLPGKAILKDGSANLGLLDQRLGLQWVADNIAAFGGDPSKVTIWGESAGSISVFDQMALYNGKNTYKGKPLFRAAIMNSGTMVPSDPVDCPKSEVVFNTVVTNAGCGGATDKLACLRSLDYTTYLNAANSVPGIFGYNSVALSYLPRPDGTVLTKSPDVLVANGQYAKVPMIVGDQEDEGTLFSLSQSNISTTDQVVQYFQTIFFNDATTAQIQALVSTYPDDPSAGSPFRTGPLNNVYPQYKRIAAILGDLTFTLTRRVFLTKTSQVAPTVPSWSYLASYFYGTPVAGTFHASDIQKAYGQTPDFPSMSIQAYYLSFINTMDPNKGTVGQISWPQWSAGNQLLNFNELFNTLLPDSFRSTSYDFIAANAAVLHV
ncbi:putative secreted lipase [Cryomyces minteri]|uniref:Carboxylic ester hydrolase n=1 Tax=Cryomyces minteri TaxID=331657 RepID=A0A4U0XBD1_9PEZI|nr:putative secreted lipase [Cryomyces minteri]